MSVEFLVRWFSRSVGLVQLVWLSRLRGRRSRRLVFSVSWACSAGGCSSGTSLSGSNNTGTRESRRANPSDSSDFRGRDGVEGRERGSQAAV